MNDVAAQPPSPYDAIAGLYHADWDDWYLPQACIALNRLLFSRLEPGAHVLDVCCGSGHVSRELLARSFRVTGIDLSSGLIEHARRHLPRAEFLVADIRSAKLDRRFDAALSTFDSMNHLIEIEDLEAAFHSVHRALLPGASFLFDMNTELAYAIDWRQWTPTVKPGNVSLVRGTFDPLTKRVETSIIWFLPAANGLWERRDTTVPQRCYEDAEVRQALQTAGFSKVTLYTSEAAGVTGEIGYGRVFYLAEA
jgi:SAM-dependent methyltransferase